MDVLAHCDGSADCEATEHIEGCFATMHRRRDIPRLPLTEENERLRRQLAGAVEALLKIAVEGPGVDMRGVALNELQRLGVDLATYRGQ